MLERLIVFGIFSNIVNCLSSCIPELTTSLKRNTPIIEYLYYSGKGFDDLGRYDDCIEKKDSKYALVVADYLKIDVMLGICVPDSCSKTEIKESFVSFLGHLDQSKILDTDSIEVIYSKDYSEESLSFSSILAMTLILLYLKFVMYGSYLHYKADKDQLAKSVFKSVVIEMAVQRNFTNLMKIVPNQDALQCLNGIRTFASSTLIALHILIFSLKAAFVDFKTTQDIPKDLSHKFIFLFFYNIDVFFLMSGLLMSYLAVAEVRSKGSSFSWTSFIIKRFLRYSPVYYLTITITIFLLRHAGSGPQWPMVEKIFPTCEDYWWTPYLYLQNLIPYIDSPCAGWVWYVSTDFQFYLLSPLIIILYLKNKTFGYLFSVLLLLANFLYVGIISDAYELTPTFTPGFSDNEQYGLIYSKPFARIAPFLMGVVIGWVYRNFRDKEKSEDQGFRGETYGDVFENLCIFLVSVEKLRRVLYVVGFGLIVWVNFIVYQLDDKGQDYWSQDQKSAFLVFHRFLFTIGFCFWIFPVLMGHCRALKNFLCIPLFQVTARTSYSLYMTHCLLLIYFFFSRSQAIIIDGFYLFISSISLFFIAHIIAAFVAVAVEFPIISIERKFLRN